MRRLIAITSVFAVTAGAGYINVISSFDPRYETFPAVTIEYDGSYLWTGHLEYLAKWSYPAGTREEFYKVQPRCPFGIAYDGTYLYTTDGSNTTYVYKLDPVTGSTVASFSYPSGVTYGGDLAYGDGVLYFDDYYNNRLWRLTTAGSVISSTTLEIELPFGLAYDDVTAGGPFVWCTSRPAMLSGKDSYIYQLTPGGSIVESAPWPIPKGGAAGLGFDGTYLWGIQNNLPPAPVNIALRMLFVSDISVAPASVGRIKALYR